MPFGYISNFTDDRNALVIMPTGGKLVKTTTYLPKDNKTTRNACLQLDGNGSARIQLSCNYQNLAIEKTHFYAREMSGEKPITAVKREVNLPSFDLESYTAELYKHDESCLEVNFALEARNLGRRVGDKLLVKPFILETFIPSLESDTARIHPVFFKHGYTYSDTISVDIPTNMRILEPLQEMEETSKFGEISLHVKFDETERVMQISRTFRLNSGEYKAEEYEGLVLFLGKLRKSENCFFILH